MREPAAKIFDTLSYAKKLKQAGFTEQQAEVQAETLLAIIEGQFITQSDLKELATPLKEDMTTMRRGMSVWLGSLLGIGAATLGIALGILCSLQHW